MLVQNKFLDWYTMIKTAQALPIVYRICIMRRNPRKPVQAEIRPLYTNPKSEPQWLPILVGKEIPASVRVGTKVKFCLAYYAGCTDLKPWEKEVLLTLEVPENQISKIPTPQEDSFMGGEAVIDRPRLLKIESVEQARNNQT